MAPSAGGGRASWAGRLYFVANVVNTMGPAVAVVSAARHRRGRRPTRPLRAIRLPPFGVISAGGGSGPVRGGTGGPCRVLFNRR